MPSFDVVCKPNMVEVRNAIDQANKEIANRFDFKGSDARFEQKDFELTAYADDEFKLGQVRDVLTGKIAKRGVDARLLEYEKPEKISGDKLKQPIKIKNGIDQTLAKKIVALVKASKLKVSASIQGDAVRISGAKKDALQECIALRARSSSRCAVDIRKLSRLGKHTGQRHRPAVGSVLSSRWISLTLQRHENYALSLQRFRRVGRPES